MLPDAHGAQKVGRSAAEPGAISRAGLGATRVAKTRRRYRAVHTANV